MTWSFQLRNGDLAHDKGRYAIAQGPTKIAQDLRIWLLTKLGQDEGHLWFGSTIDGGTEGANELGSVLDLNNPALAAVIIESEIQRWVTQYQNQQLERIRTDMAKYGNVTLRKDEILEAISDIDFQMVQDTLFVRVMIKPANGSAFPLAVPVVTG